MQSCKQYLSQLRKTTPYSFFLSEVLPYALPLQTRLFKSEIWSSFSTLPLHVPQLQWTPHPLLASLDITYTCTNTLAHRQMDGNTETHTHRNKFKN